MSVVRLSSTKGLLAHRNAWISSMKGSCDQTCVQQFGACRTVGGTFLLCSPCRSYEVSALMCRGADQPCH